MAAVGIGNSLVEGDEWPEIASLIMFKDDKRRKAVGNESESKSNGGCKGRTKTADAETKKP